MDVPGLDAPGPKDTTASTEVSMQDALGADDSLFVPDTEPSSIAPGFNLNKYLEMPNWDDLFIFSPGDH